MTEDIKELKKTWNDFGESDPLWAILGLPDKKGNRWKLNDFFETGIVEIEGVMQYVESLGVHFERRKALDFGCGVGRLTQALCLHFTEVSGVDIAPSMIESAETLNSYHDRCKYYLNDTDDLKLFSNNTFDFVYTNMTLQHMEAVYARRYILEFMRVLVPKGALIFQEPSERKPGLKKLIKTVTPSLFWELHYKITGKGQPRMQMHGIKRKEIVALLRESGGRILDIAEDRYAGPDWIGFRYCVSKG